MKKISVILSLIIFLNMQAFSVYAYQLIPEYLCQSGIDLYRQGKFREALSEFKKALLAQPYYATALEYIKKIERLEMAQKRKEKKRPQEQKKSISGREKAIKETFGSLVKQKLLPRKDELRSSQQIPLSKKSAPAEVILPKVIKVDEFLNKPLQAIEIEQNKSIIISGQAIKRFLVTQPNILKVVKNNADELLVTGNMIGYTYLQVWDNRGLNTLEFFTGFPKPDIKTLEEMMRLAEEKARNFKLNYSLDWSVYEEGRSLTTLKRSSYSFIHSLGLKGETPYGDLDSALSINRFQEKTDLGYYTIGLTHGKLGPFSEFNLRGFDFFDIPPDFSNLIFPGISLRGGVLSSPAFRNRLNYTVFAGQENWAGFGNLSPDINKRRKSYLDGLNLRYTPTTKEEYQFTLVQGFGKDRNKDLHNFGYDILGKLNLGKLRFRNETAYNSEAFANIFNTSYVLPKLNFASEFRNINKKFTSSTGSSSRQGELGWLSNLYYEPLDNLLLQATFDFYRDRLYPAQDNSKRFNEDLNLHLNYRINPLTALRMNYTFQNDLGKISQYRYQNTNLGITKTFKLIKDINFYSDYYHQENTSYSSHSSDYVNDRIYTGLRLNISRALYYYINEEMNWLKESFTGNHSRPNALETGLDWSSQIGQTPWYSNIRFTYRNEENTLSNLSFLSGEDYIEGYSQMSYRPSSDIEIYGSCRMRNVWADNPRVTKHFEANINGGMRYLWDTGINWQPLGSLDGFVFKDSNADGIMQRGEAPVAKVKLWLGEGRSAVTDIFGYYKFKDIRARKVYVNLDTATLPAGFVLTVPPTQGEFISHGGTVRVNFGVGSRSEVYGFIFEDKNNNGVYDKDEPGIPNVTLTLDEKNKRSTENSGRYSFSNVSVGTHTLRLDLSSLPVYYLPQVPIIKKLTVSEEVSYFYNIPLKKRNKP